MDYTWKTGGTGVTITLNPDAMWSDGEAVDADDVICSYELAMAATAYKVDMGKRIDSIVKVDAHTVEINLKTGYEYSSLLKVWLTGMIPIVPEHIWTYINSTVAGDIDTFDLRAKFHTDQKVQGAWI